MGIRVKDDPRLPGAEEIWIPDTYISDKATVPWLTICLVPGPDLELASYPHDYIYSHLYKYYSKEFADDVFKATLEATPHDIPRWKVEGSYWGVKTFGRGSW